MWRTVNPLAAPKSIASAGRSFSVVRPDRRSGTGQRRCNTVTAQQLQIFRRRRHRRARCGWCRTSSVATISRSGCSVSATTSRGRPTQVEPRILVADLRAAARGSPRGGRPTSGMAEKSRMAGCTVVPPRRTAAVRPFGPGHHGPTGVPPRRRCPGAPRIPRTTAPARRRPACRYPFVPARPLAAASLRRRPLPTIPDHGVRNVVAAVHLQATCREPRCLSRPRWIALTTR